MPQFNFSTHDPRQHQQGETVQALRQETPDHAQGETMNKQTIHPMTTAGIVCPHCWKPLTFFTVFAPEAGSDGVARRHYSGWCARMSCGHGVIALQYLDGSVWKMNQFKVFMPNLGAEDGSFLESDWIVVNPLPGPEAQDKPEPHISGASPATPVLILGPGGDYQRMIEVTGDSLLATLAKILGQAKDTVEAMMPLWRSKHDKPANAETHHEHNC
jgi:hypothetical protein